MILEIKATSSMTDVAFFASFIGHPDFCEQADKSACGGDGNEKISVSGMNNGAAATTAKSGFMENLQR